MVLPHPVSYGPFNKKDFMSGKASRNKGHNFERAVANKFADAGYTKARRHLEYHEDDCHGVDLDNTGPFKVQCKAHKNYVSINTINEIKDLKQGEIPVLITKGDRLEPMAALPAKDFYNLVEAFTLLKTYQWVSIRGDLDKKDC
jgi:hypothetical protein